MSPAKPITCDGQVAEWSYLAKRLHPFQAVIWRSVNGSSSKYKVVGINNIPKGSAINQVINYHVPKNERVSVKVGDMIGFSFTGAGGVIAVTFDSKYAAEIKVIYLPLLNVNQIVDFMITQKRHYSIGVTVIQGTCV